jgi:hypothetical protein
LWIVQPVGIVDDGAALVGADAVAVDDPVQGGPVAQPVVAGLRRDARQGEKVVDDELGFVAGETALSVKRLSCIRLSSSM